MDERQLLLLMAAVAGLFVWRLMVRLASSLGEVPVKTATATLLCGLGALEGLLPYSLGEPLERFTLIVGPLFAIGPLLPVALARGRMYRAGAAIAHLLYWGREGREALDRLLAQVALRNGDTDSAVRLSPAEDTLLLAHAHGLAGEWEKVLELDLPKEGEPGFAAAAARIEALVMVGRAWQAESELERLRTRWNSERQSPIGFRSIRLSEARLAAERGDISGVRDLLTQPLQGVPPHRLVAIVARAAERAGKPEDANRLYREAYKLAPEGLRSGYANRLRDLGSEPPVVPARVRLQPVTPVLVAVLALAYLGQSLLDRSASLPGFLTALRPSSVAAAFMVNMPALIPDVDAWWRYLSYAFVHGNLLHIGFNAWVLFDIGRIYEGRRGGARVLASFTAGSAMGAYISLVAAPATPVVLVGASGGVLGVAGALLVDALASPNRADRQLAGGLVRWMLLIALLSVAIPNVSLWGHVGGVVGGALWGLVRQGLPASRLFDSAAGVVSVLLLGYAALRAVELGVRLLP